MNNLLINRKWNIEGNWYAPSYFLKKFPSVTLVEYINTCSSAGDWDGLFVQKCKNSYYVIPFSQENNFPYTGFTLYTGEILLRNKFVAYAQRDLYKIYDLLSN